MSSDNPAATLKKLGLSESEVSAYLALTRHGALTVRELIKQTHMKRPTAYYALKQLEEKGLARGTGQRGVERFQAEAPSHLTTLLELRRQELEALEKEITVVVLPALKQGRPVQDALPTVSFHEGETAMKQVIMDTLMARGKHIDSIAPSDNFFWQVGQSFSQKYINQRVAKKITTRNLWERPLKPELMVRSYKGLSNVRILPASMHGAFRTTIFLYDNTVLYISSQKTGYALLVQSSEHFGTMQAIFNGLWENSTAIGKERGL